MQPDDTLETAYIDRGQSQWAYGALTFGGCYSLLDALLADEPPSDCHLLDLGSGVGQLVLYAVGVHGVGSAAGIELVPSRHKVAIAAREALCAASELSAAQRSRVTDCSTLTCADALDDTSRASYANATHVYLSNAVFTPELSSRFVAHAVEHAPRMRALACLAEPPAEALFDEFHIHSISLKIL